MKTFTARQRCLLFFVLLLTTSCLYAHTINYELENAPLHHVVGYYMKLGVEHIIPNGLDHILFVTGLCLLSTRLKTILWQATAFTVAHSITLALSMKGVVTLPAAIVEPIISLSILFVAVENMVLQELKARRVFIVFLFGLIHGLGFASALNEIGLPRNQFLTSILSFNLGVELGQVIVIALVFAVIIFPFGKKQSYRKWLVFPLSTLIAVVALWWTLQRI